MKRDGSFDLFVFHRTLHDDIACVQGGAIGIVVDFETIGKAERQLGFDTQISEHGFDDLFEVKRKVQAYTICRINAFGVHSIQEINQILEVGVDEILMPMVRNIEEVIEVLELVDGKAQIGVMIETLEAVDIASQLDQMPLSRVYVGLNDLHICRGSDSLFTAMVDGTVERIREKIKNTPFGFGGLTIPNFGRPLPVEHFFNELTRLDCQFSFLRRSFFNDTVNKMPQVEIPNILAALRSAMDRTEEIIEQDKNALAVQLNDILRLS